MKLPYYLGDYSADEYFVYACGIVINRALPQLAKIKVIKRTLKFVRMNSPCGVSIGITGLT